MNSSLASPKFNQRWFIGGLTLFFLAVTISYFLKIHAVERGTRSAFTRWQNQILEIEHGADIWSKHNYPNPPIMVLILKPLADLPTVLGSMTWLLLKIAMTILAIHWVFSMLERTGAVFPLWGKCLALLLALRPIQGDLMHGNVNLFILFLVVASLYAYCQKQDLLAGLGMALAVACKVTPILFVPYFVWKRAWSVLAYGAVGMVLFLWVVPSLFLGWDKNQEGLESWFENMILPFVIKGEITPEHQNQSLPGLAARMLTPSPSFSERLEGNIYIPLEFHNFADIDPALIRWGLKGCMALFALLVIWSCRASSVDRGGWRVWAEFSLIALGMLLFSERTWKHHCVMLLLPFGVLSYALSTRRHDKTLRTVMILSLAAATLLMLSTSTGLFDRHDRIGKLAQVYGAYVWAYLVLIGAIVFLLRRGERDAISNADETEESYVPRPAAAG